MKSIMIGIPPKEEQTAIAHFLDRKTEQIDQAIEIKQKQIELLKEKRQILIQKAVTRGLNPEVPLKPSGVDWIGDIPEHWEVKKVKYLMMINNGKDHSEVVADTGYPVIGSGGRFAYATDYLYDGEALLMGRKGTIDKPLYFKGKFWTVDTMFYAIVFKNYSTKFLYYSAMSIPFKFYSTSTALPSMTQFDLKNHKIVVPPLEEQKKIVEWIENRIIKIDITIDQVEEQIKKHKEYKTTLINSAVTGKIKVS